VTSADTLLDLAAELVAIPSVSHHEGRIADTVEAALRSCAWLQVDRVEDNVVARTDRGRAHRLLVAGHLDTVPPAEGHETTRVDAGVLFGLGASDMKGGIATFLCLATTIVEPIVDVTWCFYACEEVAQRFNGLRRLWEVAPGLLEADAAVLGEPTGGLVEAGCQGTMRVRITLTGARAHTARPFMGRNAVHRLGPLLDTISGFEGRRPVIDGCTYAEQLQVVEVTGGIAGNVVPDRASLLVNHRFAPDRSVEEAEQALRRLFDRHLESDDSWTIEEASPGAPPGLDHPLLADLVAATGVPPRAKVGWSDVATFWEHGIPAANFGPADPLLAHTPGEHVSADELAHAQRVLEGLLRTSRDRT